MYMNSNINYDVLLDYNKICHVYYKICISTKHKEKLTRFELYKFSYFMNLYSLLKNETYVHDKYNIFLVKYPKYRIIMSENLCDKVVNHLLSIYVLLPVIEPKLIDMNVATRKGKGLEKGLFFVKKYLHKIKNKKYYVLKCDIHKYFYNIDHQILIEMLSNVISDERIIKLIKKIVISTDSDYVNKNINRILEKENNLSDNKNR